MRNSDKHAIDENDSCFEILEKICNDAYLSLERTLRNMAPEDISAAANLIAGAGKTVLIGLGSSASVAQDAANKFLRAGCQAYSYGDTHMQMIAVSLMKEGDVLVGVSQSGASKDIVEAMKLAKSRGISTVSITGTERSDRYRGDETQFSCSQFSSFAPCRYRCALLLSCLQERRQSRGEDR